MDSIPNLQDTHSRAKVEGHWLAFHGRPHDQWLTPNRITRRASTAAHTGRAWECDRHGNAASVAVCSVHSGTRNSLPVSGVRVHQLWAACIAGFAVQERLCDVIVLQRYDRPVGQARELLDYSLDPDLQQRIDALRADLVCADACRAHVGLMEHVWIVAQAEEVTRCSVFFEC
jgi:hypothetical protein